MTAHLAPTPSPVILVLKNSITPAGQTMKSIDLMYQTMLAELGQRSLDAAWTADFPPEGRFTPAYIKGRKYWYFDVPDGHGGTTRRYVGPAGDKDIAQRVADHKRELAAKASSNAHSAMPMSPLSSSARAATPFSSRIRADTRAPSWTRSSELFRFYRH